MVESIGVTPEPTVQNLRNAGLGQEDFLRILLAQLSFQDPLKPMDNQEFIAQIAQFSGLELNRQSNESVDTLLTMQAAAQAIGLIGKTVEVRTDDGQSQIGTVGTITFDGATPMLTVRRDSDGTFLPPVGLSRVFLVRE